MMSWLRCSEEKLCLGRILIAVTLLGLALAGVLGARAAGTTLLRPTMRVLIGGTAAMIVTASIGRIANVSGL